MGLHDTIEQELKALEILRNKAFWAIDSIRGSQVRKAYDIIEKCDKGIWSDDQIEDYQREYDRLRSFGLDG